LYLCLSSIVMSLQLSPHSNNKNLGHNLWRELIKFAEILSNQSSLESQLSCTANNLERYFSCKPRIWLEASFLDSQRGKDLLENATQLSDLTPLMEQAYHERQIQPNIKSDSSNVELNLSIAIPLMIKDEIMGIIQLDRNNQTGFTFEEVELINGFAIQLSISLNYLRQKTLSDHLQEHVDQLRLVEEISQSILSNLDRESLLNNVISLLHQEFGFSRVSILITQGDNKKVLNKIRISSDGIEPEKTYYPENENGPVAWCISHLEPIVIDDLNSHKEFSISGLEDNDRSELVLPIIHGDVLIGVLDLCSNTANEFRPDTIKIFKLLAENIGVAIRNANLYRFEQMRRQIADQLQDEVGSLSANITIDDALLKILGVMEKFFTWDASAIWLSDSIANDTGLGQFTSSYRLAAARIKEQIPNEGDKTNSLDSNDLIDPYIQSAAEANDLLASYPWLSDVINAKIPELRNSGSSYEPLGAILGFKSEYSALGAPLTINGQPVGIIDLVHHLPEQYDGESISSAKAFSNYASTAIENTRLYAVAHDQAWITTVLLQVAEATQSITNLEELLESVAGMLPGLIGVDACMIFLWDPSFETFFSRASNGFDDEQLARLKEWEIYPGTVIAFDKLQQSRSPVILNTDTLSDEMASEVFPNYDFNKDLLMLFPLISQDWLCGAILLDFSNSNLDLQSSQEVWDEKYTLIQGAAHQAAIAIENLQLVKSQEEEAYISVALLQVSQAVVSLNQLDDILGSIVRITPILVGVNRCIIYLWDAKDLVFRQSQFFGFSKSELAMIGQEIKANEFPFIDTIKSRDQIIYHSLGTSHSPIFWNEIEADDYDVVEGNNTDSDEDRLGKGDNRALSSKERLLIGFPLSVKGEILGVMLIEEENPIKGSPSLHIREKRIEIVKGISQQAAIAIKNELLQQEVVKSERMERELQLAREIQATFLPDRLPEIPGWDIDVRWQPARQVGGDFYDFIMLDENRIGFVIADVADKGMPAALFMTLIRTLIRSATKEKSSPAAVLKQVNELLIPDSKHGMFVTVFYGVLSLNSGMVEYANAGHNPPIVKQTSRDNLIELTRTSMALGLFNNIEIEDRELFLNPGDWLLLYTDGVTEAFSNQGEMFGKERLFNILMDHQFISSNRLLDLIEESINEFIQGTDLSDDMTLAALCRKTT
jgi:sigma-B regulation protein RsbU (phosphoserine phosphatase)